jgi:hypothetical protein
VTLECAGNGRAFLEPPVGGEQWRLGAVGTAEWTGVPLRELLRRAEPTDDALEVLFRGADRGTPKELEREIAFERSLPLAAALDDDVLVAYAMDGAPLAPEHGAPWRLVVPGRYGVASVKWLERITISREPFTGFYQRTKYVIGGEPLGRIAPRAVIVAPEDGARIEAQRHTRIDEKRQGPSCVVEILGYAWSGGGEITRVEVSMESPALVGERTWRDAALGPATSPSAWREFSAKLLVIVAGRGMELAILARATDASGATQPLTQNWNSLGYVNNAARPVRVRIA